MTEIIDPETGEVVHVIDKDVLMQEIKKAGLRRYSNRS